MNLEQAIKTALEYENKVFMIYKEAEEKASDPVGKRIFSVMAKEEQGHIDYLNNCLEQWRQSGKLAPEELSTVVPSEEQLQESLERMKQQVADKGTVGPEEVELLQKAVEAEKTTSGFYKQMVSELDEAGQQLFKRFVEIEEGHLAIVSAELDSVTGLGYWFDVPEWQFQDG